MKESWKAKIEESNPFTEMLRYSKVHYNGRRIAVHENVAIEGGKLLPEGNAPTHKITGLKATVSLSKLCIEAVSLENNEVITINL